MSAIHYRPDIDGLRALAVLSVVLFHYHLWDVPGGFVGVDVFFVISGYLITSIISRSIERGDFSFVGFYDRRVRRILPAALVLILATLAAGYFLLLPSAYTTLGTSSGYSAAGLANFYFFWNTGYFDTRADLQPMLHMWSLAVEEQFYLVWPIVLLIVARLSRNSKAAIVSTLVVVIVASFAASQWMVAEDPKAAFYMPHSRAWELALGALLVFLPRLRGRALPELLAVAGLVLVVASFFLLDSKSPFPGTNAAYPVVGAALLIWPSERPTWVARALSLPPLVFVGKISFSLYLYHWPVIVLYRLYGTGVRPGTEEALALALLSLLLAVMSWKFVEQPFRRRAGRDTVNVAVGALALCAVAGAGLAVAASSGVPARLPPEARALEQYASETVTDQNDFDSCFITSATKGGLDAFSEEKCLRIVPGRRNVLLVGDSHAAHYSKALREAYPDINFAQVTSSGCFPVMPRPASRTHCARLYRVAFNDYVLKGRFDAVILAGRWTKANSRRLPFTVRKLAPHVEELIVIGPIVEYTSRLPTLLAKSALRSDDGAIVDAARRYGSAKRKARIVSKRLQGMPVTYYSSIEPLCPRGKCITTVDGRVPVQFDGSHLTYEGASLVVGRLKSQGLLRGISAPRAAPGVADPAE